MKYKNDIADNEFDALLFLNGDLPTPAIINAYNAKLRIAVDGGANKLKQLNLTPDIVIGDLDSYDGDFDNNSDIEKIKIEEQDTNDLEKALNHCEDNSLNDILIFGTNGGELEHILNNFSVLKKYISKLNMILHNGDRLAFLLGEGEYQFSSELDDIVSLIPLPLAEMTTQGLLWELDNEVLELGTREGARNKALARSFNIDVHSGHLILFLNIPNKNIET